MDDDDEDEEEDPYDRYQREFGVSGEDKDVSRALTGGLQKTVSLDYEIRIDFLAYVYVQFCRIETLYFKPYLLIKGFYCIYLWDPQEMSRTSEGVTSNAEDSMGMFMQSRKAEIDGVQVKKRTRRLLDESDED